MTDFEGMVKSTSRLSFGNVTDHRPAGSNSDTPDLTSLIRLRDGVYAADLLIVAVSELDFFSALEQKSWDLPSICEKFGIKPRPADVTCTLFCAMGLLDLTGGSYRLTGLASSCLVAGSPYDLRDYFTSLRDRPACRELLQVLRTGKPVAWASSGEGTEWAEKIKGAEFARSFTAAMDARGRYLAGALAEAVDLSGSRRLLDVAGGSGIYAWAIRQRWPDVETTVLEKPPVDEVVQTLLHEKAIGEGVHVASGDMFERLPTGFDVHLFSHVLHDWGEDDARRLIANSFAALLPGGLFLDHDVHMDRDKRGPLSAAEYSVLLMHSTEGKCYSLGELEDMLAEAGFDEAKEIPTAGGRSVISATKT